MTQRRRAQLARMAKEIDSAALALGQVKSQTPLLGHVSLSELLGAKVYFKREDQGLTRSYKERGAFNRIRELPMRARRQGIVCASAGNHAQGVALWCARLKIKCVIYMPLNTPPQKVQRVEELGNGMVRITLVGDTYDHAYAKAREHAKSKKMTFVHAFNDHATIIGQGTIAPEIIKQLGSNPDYVIVPVGGGGLISGIGAYLKVVSPHTKVIGVEASGSAGMTASLKKGKVVTLGKVDTFVDGTAVRTVGKRSFKIAEQVIDEMVEVPEGLVCEAMMDLFQRDGIIAEPAGALSVAALHLLRKRLKGKTVVCIISGGNFDMTRYPQVFERAIVHKGLRHYFLIRFPQRPGILRDLVSKAIGPGDDVTQIEYHQKDYGETGPGFFGITLRRKEGLPAFKRRMDKLGLRYEVVPTGSQFYRFMI